MFEQSKYNENAELVTFLTAGSVDDGKSTLIGRMLYDSGALFQDQKESIENADLVEGEFDYSLVTDGLAAEREQKITIDVAYRYFATKKRRFIIADAPGHEEYTRNMVTAASKAQIALILIDAKKGVLTQTKRHLFIASLLGIRHIAVVVNKMDTVQYDEEVFNRIERDVLDFSAKLDLPDLQFIPVSSLKGDMVVMRGNAMPWYGGRTVLNYLETVSIVSDRNLIDFRFPVQMVIRPHQGFRGYAGKIASGVVRPGDEIMVLPSGKMSRIQEVFVGGTSLPYAYATQSVLMTLTDNIDVSRGNMLVRPKNRPMQTDTVESMLCVLADTSVEIGKTYLMKLGTEQQRVHIQDIQYRINVDTLHRESIGVLGMNDIGRVVVQSQATLLCDPYKKNKETGAYILVDEATKQTVAAGMILNKGTRKEQPIIQKQGRVLWFTGLSGSGKTTIASAVAKRLSDMGIRTEHLDGDVLRSGITADLGFSKEDRQKNISIAGFVAKKLAEHGVTVLATFVSPYKEKREELKKTIPSFVEIYVNTPLAVCEERDVKGLYKKARRGDIQEFTGISQPYEAPDAPDMTLDTSERSIEECAEAVIQYITNNG